jgi:hypothetical protein
VQRTIIADAVDRVASALASRDQESRSTHASGTIVAVCADSMPDLASRLRRTLAAEGGSIGELGSATEGRHTVVTLLLGKDQEGIMEKAATQLGARVVKRGGVA